MPGTVAAPGKRAERTRAAILDAAEVLFAERGFSETRLEDVAERVGIRRPSLVYHFASKAELYAAVIAEGMADLRSRYTRAIIAPATHRQRLERLLATWLDFCVERRSFLRVLMRELSGTTALPPSTLQQNIGSLLEPVRAVIRAGQQAGAFRDVDPTHFIFTIAGMSTFLLVAAPLASPEEYPDGIQPVHIDRLRGELLRASRGLLGAPAATPLHSKERQ